MTASPSASDGTTGGRSLFGPEPTIGPGAAGKAVAEDISALVRAELDLAKAEVARSVKAKATGGALLAVAAVVAWLALQGLLVTAGFALALVVPGWAAALIVSAALLLLGVVLGAVGARKLGTPLSLETTKHNVQEDLQWTRAALRR